MNVTLFSLGILLAPIATSQVMPFNYRVGATVMSEDAHQIVVHAVNPVTISIQPGGTTWPVLSLDDTGRIYAGNIVIDAASGKAVVHDNATLTLGHDIEISTSASGFVIRQSGKSCALSARTMGLDPRRSALDAIRTANVAFSSGANALLALVTQFGADGKVAHYLVDKIDIHHCSVTHQENIGNPDLLLELGNSAQGGWWMTGSIEQTLLQSFDGRHWRSIPLPAGLSSLISAYVTNDREIWLAGILPSDESASPYLIVYSDDGGRHWRNIVQDDLALARLPAGWLEGQRRRILQ